MNEIEWKNVVERSGNEVLEWNWMNDKNYDWYEMNMTEWTDWLSTLDYL